MSSNINISINNFNKICRTCSQTNDLVSIHENIYLLEMLTSSAHIQIQLNDELPKNICLKCIKDLNQSYAFISKCKTNDAAFRQCLIEQKLLHMREIQETPEEIFIKTEIPDVDDYDSISGESKQDTNQSGFENKHQKGEFLNFCANCNKTFPSNEELISHLNECQFRNLLEPAGKEESTFDFLDTSTNEATETTTKTSVDLNLLPKRSKKIYEETYRRFMDYCKEKSIQTYPEDVLIVYFDELSKKMKSSTLWATYSMLKANLNVKHNLDMSKYLKLRAFLKHQSNGYQPKISKVLDKQQIEKFLFEAPDDTYLTTKVALVIGVAGACKCEELLRLTIDDVKDMGTKILIAITDSKKNKSRWFVVHEHLEIFRKYAGQRPEDLESHRFFFKYSNGKPSKQLIGIHKFGSMPQEIASFLNLPNVKDYTGHCFRRTSAARELWG